jgi:hypothetical protein
MSKVSNALPLTIPLNIPAYWTPEQAFAVYARIHATALTWPSTTPTTPISL